MKENTLYFVKLSGFFIWTFFKKNFLGALFTAVFFVLGLIALSKELNTGNAGHASSLPLFIFAIVQKPFTVIPFYLIIVASPFILFSFAGKFALAKTIHKLMNDKSDTLLVPFIDKMVLLLVQKQPSAFKSKVDAAKSKLKLIEDVKSSKENKIVKKIVVYGLEKINLNDVDFSDQSLSFPLIIRNKIIDKLKSIVAPSNTIFWIVIGLQVLFLGLISFT